MGAHLEREAKGQESQPSVSDERRGAKTHDDGHPPLFKFMDTLYKEPSTAQVNAMRKNFF